MKQAIQYFKLFCYIAGVHKLTNMRKGTYYGISERWSEKEKRDMGFYFLRRALKIFKEEGERPLLPGDLKGGQ